MLKYGFIIIILFVSLRVEADEVLLKNGKIWTNVNILESNETKSTITIFNSMKKKIVLNKNDVSAIKLSKFNSFKESLYIDNNLTAEELIDFERLDGGTNITNGQVLHRDNSTGVVVTISKSDSMLMAFPKIRLNVSGGYSYARGGTNGGLPTKLKDYQDDLNSAGNITVDLTFFIFNHKNGLSFKYSRFATSGSISDVYTDEGYFSYSDDISISFFGAGWTQRFISANGKMLLISTGSAGMLLYKDNGSVSLRSSSNYEETLTLEMEGTTFGINAAIGLEYLLSEKLGIGVEIAYIGGNLKTMKVNGSERTIREGGMNLFHFNFNIGLQYYFDIK